MFAFKFNVSVWDVTYQLFTGATVRKIASYFSIAAVLLFSLNALSADLYVSKQGNDTNVGSKQSPFLTINKAANLAQAGDTVYVENGIYRESILAPRGGHSDTQRITYKANGDNVIISGSEVINTWEQDKQTGLWKVALPKAYFADYNPFAKLIRSDEYVVPDETSKGWGWLMYGRRKHRGDVYFNGEGFVEKENVNDLTQAGTWYVDISPEERFTMIWANFGAENPNEHSVEINVRPYGFLAENVGTGYITVEGFTFKNFATHWAPPTTFQLGVITANGGHHWNIKDNNVLYSKGLCISLGEPNQEAPKEMKKPGYHTVEGNILLRCGQSGVAGLGWGSHSTIRKNIIEDTNYRMEYGGWETAAIKFHVLTDMEISDNFIKNIKTLYPGAAHGIWVDFKNTHFYISRNIVIDAQKDAILFEANWGGPFLVENNIVINGTLNTMSSQDEVWAHNLFVKAKGRWVDQDYGDRPPVKDARWYNNLFLGGSMENAPENKGNRIDHNVYLSGAKKSPQDAKSLSRAFDAKFEYTLSDKAMQIQFNQPTEAQNIKLPLISSDFTNQPLKRRNQEAARVEHDFFGQKRSEKSLGIGPFSTLKAGINTLTVYQFPDRYARIKAMTGSGYPKGDAPALPRPAE